MKKIKPTCRYNVVALDETATIHLEGRFTFLDHGNFEASCKKFLTNPQIKHVIVNLAKVEYIDSAALGMLLVLRKDIQAISVSLVLSSPSATVLRALKAVHFEKLLTIQ